MYTAMLLQSTTNKVSYYLVIIPIPVASISPLLQYSFLFVWHNLPVGPFLFYPNQNNDFADVQYTNRKQRQADSSQDFPLIQCQYSLSHPSKKTILIFRCDEDTPDNPARDEYLYILL